MHLLTERSEWKTLNAVKARRVWLADGNECFNRSGPRIVESVELLAAMLHPTLFERNLSAYLASEWIERIDSNAQMNYSRAKFFISLMRKVLISKIFCVS